MNEELIEQIEKAGTDGNGDAAEQAPKTSWLIFSICGKKYAVRSCEVREIIRDLTIYKLPFLPSYIEGVINRRGDPFTVINPLPMIEGQNDSSPKEPLFLLLKRDDDQISLHISDILFFHDVEDSELHGIANNDDDIFLGTFDYKGEEIPALNTESFEVILRKDMGSMK